MLETFLGSGGTTNYTNASAEKHGMRLTVGFFAIPE